MVRGYAPATVVYPYDENSASADSKYGGTFCDSTGIPAVAESGKASRGIRAVMVNRSAQIQSPAGLTDTESECRYQMCYQLTLKGRF